MKTSPKNRSILIVPPSFPFVLWYCLFFIMFLCCFCYFSCWPKIGQSRIGQSRTKTLAKVGFGQSRSRPARHGDMGPEVKHRELSQSLDTHEHETAFVSLSVSDRAAIMPEILPGASSLLHVCSSREANMTWELAGFRTETQIRLLHLPLLIKMLGAHSTKRPSRSHLRQLERSDRNRRHSSFRNAAGGFASRAGQNPVLETPGLLPSDMHERGSNLRRPAEIYTPSWQAGRPALDIAVASSQRADSLQEASQRPGAAADNYEHCKRSDLELRNSMQRSRNVIHLRPSSF